MSAPSPKPGAPTLHHLNNSQSQRILWLLEELGIEYKLVLHFRDAKTQRAPPELKEVHPLGKAPVLVTSDNVAIAESSAVAAYLLKTYDPQGRFASSDWILDESLTSFAGSSLGPIIMIELLLDIAGKRSPWPLHYLVQAIGRVLNKHMTGPELKKSFDYLESILGDKKWFNGDNLGRPDFMLIWPLDTVAQRGWVDFGKDYPKIGAWRERVLNSEGWKRAIEKGNGYDLTGW